MDADRLITALIGAFFGSAGWLFVGLYLSRRQHDRQARNAARAVYFELAINETDIQVASHHGVYSALRRDSFDRLLPELATWLDADELQTIAKAYMSHAGYDQLRRDSAIPAPVRAALLDRVGAEHQAAAELLRRRAFSTREAARLRSEQSETMGSTAIGKEHHAQQRP